MKQGGINGELMNRDMVVGKIRDGVVEIIDIDHAPLFFRRSRYIEPWLEKRAIDEHRTHSRLLKRILRLTKKDDVSTSLRVHGATLTDPYWVKLQGENLKYENIRFRTDDFADLALRGDMEVFSQELDELDSHTPELTNIGSFEKCWRVENGSWWMYKKGDDLSIFSECFVERLGKKLGFPMANYIPSAPGVIKSKDFTDGCRVIYEPMEYLIGERYDDYSLNYHELLELSADCAKQYLDILYLDAICRNPDRHEFNYGILRDLETGKVISMAPNFDNNLALFSNGIPKMLDRSNDFLIRELYDFLEKENIDYEIPIFNSNDLDEIINEIPIVVDNDSVKQFVLNGQNKMLEWQTQNLKRLDKKIVKAMKGQKEHMENRKNRGPKMER